MKAELVYDEELDNWAFHVPALQLIGVGGRTRAEAEQACLAAVAKVRDDGAMPGDAHSGMVGGVDDAGAGQRPEADGG